MQCPWIFFWTKSKIVHSKKATLLDNCQQSLQLPATALYKSMHAKFSSLVSEKSDVRNPEIIFNCQAALTKVTVTCPQLILVLKEKIQPKKSYNKTIDALFFQVTSGFCQYSKVISTSFRWASLFQVDKI